MVSMQRDRLSAYHERSVRLDDLVDTVRATVRIALRAIDQVVESSDRLVVDFVCFRASDDFPAMRGGITDDDYL